MRRRITRPTSAALLTLLALLVRPPDVVRAASDIWGSVPLPGGAVAMRSAFGLGDAEGRFDAAWVSDFVRRYGRANNWPAASARLHRYLEMFDRLASAARAADGWRLPASDLETTRFEAFVPVATALGVAVAVEHHRLVIGVDPMPEGRERGTWAAALGLDPADAVERWKKGEAVAITVSSDQVPLPLPAYWAEANHGQAPSLATILRDRPSALLYLGLASLDDETLTWLDAHHAVVDRLREHGAAALAAFGRSVHVREGVVDLPGGLAASATWARLVGSAPSDPAVFLPALLGNDAGTLAYFCDAVAWASPGTRAAILEDASTQPAAINAFYGLVREVASGWSIENRPFDRPLQDPAWAAALVDARSPGLTAAPWLPALMTRVVDGAPWPAAARPLPAPLPPGDIEWLMRWLLAKPGDLIARAQLVRFAARLPNLDRATPADAEFALRTFRDLPTLALTLERLGLTDPAFVGKVGRAAYGLGGAGDQRAVEPVLARWQTALALVEQVTRVRRLAHADRERLVLDLADIAVQPLDQVTDALTRWATDTAIPAFAGNPAPAALDLSVFAAAVVHGAPASVEPPLVWDTLAYDRSSLRIVERDLDHLIAAGGPLPRADVREIVHLQARLTSADRTVQQSHDLAADLDGIQPAGSHNLAPLDDRLHRAIDAATRALRAKTGTSEAAAAAAELPAVLGWADDAVMQPIVYALAMTPLHQPAALLGDAWSFHQLVSQGASGSDWWRQAWQRAKPEARPGGGGAMTGSWLLLDLALSDAIVPRRFDQATSLPPPVRDAILADVSLRTRQSDTFLISPDTLAALNRGRATLAGWQSAPPDRAAATHALADAGLRGARLNFALWTLARHPESLAPDLTALETLALGGGATASIFSSVSVDGCVCAGPMPPWTADETSPYWSLGVAAAFAIDLPLVLADQIAKSGLPVSLTASVLPLAAADWLAHADPYANDDWVSLGLWPRQLTAAEVEGYVLQLVSEGILMPVDEVVP